MLRWMQTRAKALTTDIVGPAVLSIPKRRALVRLKLLDGKCGDCNAWDRAVGQATIAKHPEFAQVAQMLSPEQMETAGKDDDWSLKGPDVSRATRWEDYGACAVHNDLCGVNDTCEKYQ